MPTFIGPIVQQPVIGQWTLMTQYDINVDAFRLWIFRRLADATEWVTVEKGNMVVTRTTRNDDLKDGPPPLFSAMPGELIAPIRDGLLRDFGSPASERELQGRLDGAMAKGEILNDLNGRLLNIVERTIMEKVR